jgi:hypothetical protein
LAIFGGETGKVSKRQILVIVFGGPLPYPTKRENRNKKTKDGRERTRGDDRAVAE